jgi:fatty acid amide hydrolase 2
MDELLQVSALELARRISSGETSSTSVVEKHIERIEQVNPQLNAVVRDRFEQARLEAKQADGRVRERETGLPPLTGVPCTIKESIALTGMPNSSGVVARASVIASSDATVVARLRAAGAIPIGVTNVPEITVWTSTFNNVYGRTNNAYDPARIAGGSSGGEGAIIGAGGSPFGVGTDIGGSIRIPAFCNGIFGHKPSGGLVPGTGQYPAYQGEVLRINTTGPLARRAEDLMPLLRILAGPDGVDSGCEAIELGDPAAVDLGALRVVVVEGDGTSRRPRRVLRNAQQNAAYALAALGASVQMREVPMFRQSLSITLGTMIAGGIDFKSAMADGRSISLRQEWGRLARGRSNYTYPPLMAATMKHFAGFRRKSLQHGRELGKTLGAELEELLGDDGVMLYPTSIRPAPYHGLDSSSSFRFTGIFNALQLPVTQVPLGLDDGGLPLGIQVVAAHGRDHLTIAVALALERAFGGWVAPAPSNGPVDQHTESAD